MRSASSFDPQVTSTTTLSVIVPFLYGQQTICEINFAPAVRFLHSLLFMSNPVAPATGKMILSQRQGPLGWTKLIYDCLGSPRCRSAPPTVQYAANATQADSFRHQRLARHHR